MKLKTFARSSGKKSEANRLRREGKIPVVLYKKGKDAESLSVDEAEFQSILRHVRKGHLSTTRITLVDENGQERKALIKDIQYHITTYDVLHLDFEELVKNQEIKANIPIEFTGAADCVGIKLGGVLRPVIRSIKVRCLPEHLPEFFELNVQALPMKGTKKLKDLQIPSSVKPLDNLNEVCVVIAKR